jgi:hypothetical protein
MGVTNLVVERAITDFQFSIIKKNQEPRTKNKDKTCLRLAGTK